VKLARSCLLWFCAGAGLDVQGRILDHFLDPLVRSVWWLAWLS
jgi:hypothetical protein